MDIPRDISPSGHLFEVGELQANAWSTDWNKECRGPEIDVPHLLGLAWLGGHPSSVPEPELVIEGACDQAPFVQGNDPGIVPILFLKVQVFSPVDQLVVLEFGDMKVRPLDLSLVRPSLGGF